MKLLHSALRFRVNYFSDLGRHQVVVWMPGDTPPVDAQMDVGPKIEHEVPNEVFRSDIAPLKWGALSVAVAARRRRPGPMFRVQAQRIQLRRQLQPPAARAHFQHRQRQGRRLDRAGRQGHATA
jgi:hypothetical protein